MKTGIIKTYVRFGEQILLKENGKNFLELMHEDHKCSLEIFFKEYRDGIRFKDMVAIKECKIGTMNCHDFLKPRDVLTHCGFHPYEENMVAVIFNEDNENNHEIIAMAALDHIGWIDLREGGFKDKSFPELDIEIDKLTIY